jgi:biotin-(acetyl-CoA carboxylase) ligase
MNEKLQKTLEFFKNQNIQLPIEVGNSLEDVFTENDNINDVDIYFKEDIDLLQMDLVLVNEVDAYLEKPSSGNINNTFTYYGEVDYSLSELVNLYDDKDNVLLDITNINNQGRATIVKPDMYAVVLIENVVWGEGKMEKKPKLYIYCPESGQSEEGDQ